jgi:hypothetical protein
VRSISSILTAAAARAATAATAADQALAAMAAIAVIKIDIVFIAPAAADIIIHHRPSYNELHYIVFICRRN